MSQPGPGSLIVSFALAGYLFLPKVVAAQDQPAIDCILNVPHREVMFGDSLTITCEFMVPPGYHTTDPLLTGDGFPDGIQSTFRSSESTYDGSTFMRFGFLIHAFMTDSLRIGPVQFDVATSDGKTFTVHSDSLIIAVGTVLTAADSTLYADRRPVTIAARGIPGWLVFIAVAVAVLIAYVLYSHFRKRRPAVTAAVDVPIDEISEFRKIATLGLHERGQFKELYILISSKLRDFLQRNMPFDARHETTTEIIRELDKTGYDPSISSTISSMLGEADRVMFARYAPTLEEAATAIDRIIVPVQSVLEENRRRLEFALKELSDTESSNPETSDTDSAAVSMTSKSDTGGAQ